MRFTAATADDGPFLAGYDASDGTFRIGHSRASSRGVEMRPAYRERVLVVPGCCVSQQVVGEHEAAVERSVDDVDQPRPLRRQQELLSKVR